MADAAKAEPTIEEKILADLKKSGFPLEIWAASELRARGWNVRHQGYYEDSDTKKGGTIDIIAGRAIALEGRVPDRITTQCILECKQKGENVKDRMKEDKELKPWVFYVPGVPPVDDKLLGALDLIKTVSNLDISTVLQYTYHSHQVIKENHYAVIALEAFSGGWNKTTHDAISQVTKATLHRQAEVQKTYGRLKQIKGMENSLLVLYPVILFDGPMFELAVDAKGELSVTATDHVVYYHEAGPDQRLLIDVVKREYLSKLLTAIDYESDRFAKNPMPFKETAPATPAPRG